MNKKENKCKECTWNGDVNFGDGSEAGCVYCVARKLLLILNGIIKDYKESK